MNLIYLRGENSTQKTFKHRRMFPTVRVIFAGLKDTSNYAIMMDIVPVDNRRYRYSAMKTFSCAHRRKSFL